MTVRKILDQTGSKITVIKIVQDAALRSVLTPTMDATLEARHLSALKDHLVTASSTVNGVSAKAVTDPAEEQAIFDDVCESQYTSKIRSYAQSMNFIRTAAALKVLAIRELLASMILLP